MVMSREYLEQTDRDIVVNKREYTSIPIYIAIPNGPMQSASERF